MNTVTPFAIPLTSAPVLARRDLLNLAKFRDTSGHAVSFFFSLQSIPDKSHHTEVVLVRDLVREELHQIDIRKAPGPAEDMEAVLMQVEEVRESPRHWRISYACHGQGFWRKFELPAAKPIRQLLLIWLFQQDTSCSVAAWLDRHFRRTCASFSHSSPAKTGAGHTWLHVDGRTVLCARSARTEVLAN